MGTGSWVALAYWEGALAEPIGGRSLAVESQRLRMEYWQQVRCELGAP